MKKNFKNKCVRLCMTFALMLSVLFVLKADVKAATPAPTGLKQVDARESSVEISWNAVFGDDMSYYWRVSDTAAFASARSDWAGNVGYGDCVDTISGLQAGKTYYVQVGTSATLDYNSAPADTVWSTVLSVVTKPVAVTSSTIAFTDATETSISLRWAAVEGATGYTVKYWKSDANSDSASTTTTLTASITLTGLEMNTEYTVDIYSYRQGETYTATESWGTAFYRTPTLPTKIAGVDCTYFHPSLKKGDMDLMWDENAVADGYLYEIYKYNGKKPLASGTAASCIAWDINDSKLKKNQIYKVRVCGYVNTTDNQRRCGEWSDFDYVSRCAAKGTKLKKVSGNKVKASWKKVNGATSYTVYVANKYNGNYKKMGTTKKTSFTLKKAIKKNASYYVRIVPNYKKGKVTYSATVNSNLQYSAYAHMYNSGRFYSYTPDY